MNVAKFFQKNGHKKPVRMMQKLYFALFLRSDTQRVKYLRDAGAVIGKGTMVHDIAIFGSEPYLVEVGDNTSFSGGSPRLITHDAGYPRLYYMGVAPELCDSLGKIKIGNNCFIGYGAYIMKNVTIGDNCIIGAGAVVTKSIPANSIACGVPAKVIGTVEEFYEKHKDKVDRTVGMSPYEKRCYVQQNMEKYENWRLEKINEG